jgi:hypothetical protein
MSASGRQAHQNWLNVGSAQERSLGKPQFPSFHGRPSANSRPSSEKIDKQFYKLLEWWEPGKQMLVIDLN